jgi:hypothetical protein
MVLPSAFVIAVSVSAIAAAGLGAQQVTTATIAGFVRGDQQEVVDGASFALSMARRATVSHGDSRRQIRRFGTPGWWSVFDRRRAHWLPRNKARQHLT